AGDEAAADQGRRLRAAHAVGAGQQAVTEDAGTAFAGASGAIAGRPAVSALWMRRQEPVDRRQTAAGRDQHLPLVIERDDGPEQRGPLGRTAEVGHLADLIHLAIV